MAKITIAIPIHWMTDWRFYLNRCMQSIEMQTFKDYEIVITKHGKMAENTNAAIKGSTGELVKVLYMDDYLTHENSLQNIVDNFNENDKWMVTGCVHNDGDNGAINPHIPSYSQDIHTGNNTIGSPSVLVFRREGCLYFDENLSWLLDCDLYSRYYEAYGPPKVLETLDVTIGLHGGQTSNLMSEKDKVGEHIYMLKKHK